MSEFDYKLFHNLFSELHQFTDFVRGYESTQGAKVKSRDGSDITACLDLSIFPQLRNIEKWGENIDLVKYFEVREGEKVVGEKGIIVSCMDWSDLEEPFFYYEFAHLEQSGNVEEYVRELHVDYVVAKVLANLAINQSGQEKGSDQGKALIARAIENCREDDLPDELKAEFKYRCIVEGDGFEVWKVGLHQGPYQIFLIAPNLFNNIDIDFVFNHYLRGSCPEKIGPFRPMDDGKLAEIALECYGGGWYNKGVIDLDPEATQRLVESQQLAGLEELPEFESNPFSARTDVFVYEIARITYETLPGTQPPYQRQELLSVVGRSHDSERIYVARESMLRENGELLATPPRGDGGVGSDLYTKNIDRYEVLVPHNELLQIRPERKLPS